LESRGRCFDLQAVFDELNLQFFQSGITARIGWGRHSAKRRRRSIRLGVYDHKAREIRIHPVLDKPQVPTFFVEYIVFHEMLHQLFPSQRHSGRHVHHPKAFRDREKSFPKYSAAIAWESQNLTELLRG
jgi:predicted metal-dependent hydrolase